MTVCAVADEFCKGIATKFCYLCGMPVCENCSGKREHQEVGRVTLCNCCQKILDGSDAVIVAKNLRLAGHSNRERRQLLKERYGSLAK